MFSYYTQKRYHLSYLCLKEHPICIFGTRWLYRYLHVTATLINVLRKNSYAPEYTLLLRTFRTTHVGDGIYK